MKGDQKIMTGKCKLLKIVVNEDSVCKGNSLYIAVVSRLKSLGVAGATAVRGIEGYGRRGHINTERILDLSAGLPVVIEAVDSPEKIEGVLHEIEQMLGGGLIFTMDVDVIK